MDFVTYRAANSDTYRVELEDLGLGRLQRQVNLRTGSERAVFREPPEGVRSGGVEDPASLGSVWCYNAGFREAESHTFRTPSELSSAVMKIPFPKAVSEALEEIWRARVPRVRYGPPGPCSPLWGGSALRWAQARRFDDLEIDAALCGFWAPTGTDEKTVEAADWFGLDQATAAAIKNRYMSNEDALRVLKVRWRAFQRRSGICADPDEELGRCLRKLAKGWKEEGNAHFKKQELHAALNMYEQAIAAVPTEMTYYNNKAAVLIELQQFKQCITMCQELLDRRHLIDAAAVWPADAATAAKVSRTLSRMATAYEREKYFVEALACWRSAAREVESPETLAATTRCEGRLREVVSTCIRGLGELALCRLSSS